MTRVAWPLRPSLVVLPLGNNSGGLAPRDSLGLSGPLGQPRVAWSLGIDSGGLKGIQIYLYTLEFTLEYRL